MREFAGLRVVRGDVFIKFGITALDPNCDSLNIITEFSYGSGKDEVSSA